MSSRQWHTTEYVSVRIGVVLYIFGEIINGVNYGRVPALNEKEQLKLLSKGEKTYLSRRFCALCEMPLNRPGCSAIYGGCDETTRIKRRDKCLKTYKPRKY